jgi:hypothetical protein
LNKKEPAPVYGKPTQSYDSDGMVHELGITDDGRIADFYCHFPKCPWIVQERKGANHVGDALEQLENTVTKLAEIGKTVDEGQIVMPKLSPSEAKKFRVDSKTHELHFVGQESTIRLPYVSAPVKVFYEYEIDNQMKKGKEGFDWASVSG